MERLGIDTYLLDWTQGFLSIRVSLLEVGELSIEVHPHCGVPRGSPILTTLFLIYIDDLLHRLVRVQQFNRNAFADDLILWLAGSFCNGIIHPNLHRALGLVERWAIFCYVQFSVQKCGFICYCDKNVHIYQEFYARLYGARLPHVTELWYLSVRFDESLIWR